LSDLFSHNFLIEVEKNKSIKIYKGNYKISKKTSSMVLLHQIWKDNKIEEIFSLYEKYGQNFPLKLSGQFFVFIWDESKKEFIFANDRIGVVPVYFYEDDIKIIVSDTISGILSLIGNLEINYGSIFDYFSLFWILGQKTFLKKVQKLNGGKINVDGNIYTYWDYKQKKEIKSKKKAEELIRDTLSSTIKKRTQGLKSISAHLSGGVDYSVVCSLLDKFTSDKLGTISMRIKGGKSESLWIEMIREMIKSSHKWVQPEFSEIIASIENIVHIIGDLSGYPSVISLFFLEKENCYDIVFTGRGVDELFSGYSWHLPPHLINHFKRRQVFSLTEIMNIFPDFPKDEYQTYDEYMEIYHHNKRYAEVEMSMSFDFNVLLKSWLTIEYNFANHFHHTIYSPVLEADMVEVSSKIPYFYKTDGRDVKCIFKQAFADLLPAGILNRPKMGLHMPFSNLIRTDFKESIIHTLKELSSYEEVNFKYLETKIKEHNVGTIEFGWQIWAVLSFLYWKKYIMNINK